MYKIKSTFTARQYDNKQAFGLKMGTFEGEGIFRFIIEGDNDNYYWQYKNKMRLFMERNKEKCIREVHGKKVAVFPVEFFNRESLKDPLDKMEEFSKLVL